MLFTDSDEECFFELQTKDIRASRPVETNDDLEKIMKHKNSLCERIPFVVDLFVRKEIGEAHVPEIIVDHWPLTEEEKSILPKRLGGLNTMVSYGMESYDEETDIYTPHFYVHE